MIFSYMFYGEKNETFELFVWCIVKIVEQLK